MQGQRFIRYGVLGGLVLAGVACAGNSARTEEATVAKDTTTVRNTTGYEAPIRDTTLSTMSDSAKANQTKSGGTEIKPGESTVGVDSAVGIDSTKMTPSQVEPVPANVDTLRTEADTTK